MNQVFWVQYQTNQPVKIETHYVGERERRRPLSDVADVIGAATLGTTRRLIGLPKDFGPLTLHAVVDGVEGPALEPDLPLSALSSGLTAKTALVIKSKSDMHVHDSSRTSGSGKSSRSSINKNVIQKDSIGIHTERGRPDLLAKLDQPVHGAPTTSLSLMASDRPIQFNQR
ncbi:hypothetical protein CcCBS67573_g10635, partial [Chytriomyces confervae]